MNTLFSKFKNPRRVFSVASRINPHRHWALLLQIFTGVSVCLIIFSFYLLYQIKNDQIFHVQEVVEVQPNTMKEKLLQSVTESLGQKERIEKALEANPLSYPDPSL